MTVPVEYLHRVRTACHEQKAQIGYAHPPAVGAVLTKGLQPTLEKKITRELYRHETKPFLFDGTKHTLEALLREGDHVCIWTDDYLIRLGTAGFGNLRKMMPYNERKRLFVSSAEDKFSRLPALLQYARDNAMHNAVIVDNSTNNLKRALDTVTSCNIEELQSFFVLTLQSQNDDTVHTPKGDPPETIIKNITELLDFRSTLCSSNDVKILWIIDFNHTLVDTNALDQSRIESVSTILYSSSHK